MNSREQMLASIAHNQPDFIDLPSLVGLGNKTENALSQFKTVLSSIGGQVVEVSSIDAIIQYIKTNFETQNRIVSTLEELSSVAETNWQDDSPKSLANVDLAIIKGHFGVSENGSIWVTDNQMGQRVAPFITQYLAIVLKQEAILSSMHEAYQQIADSNYGFGTFIAGPSKTADIEQSLVLGAHGARGLVVFLLI
jgi:L-lactate dehydrogenase complex protein LldG